MYSFLIKGKSALWSHLVFYARRVELMKQTNKELAINDSELLNLESSPPTSSSCSGSPRISDLRSVNVGSENSLLPSDSPLLSPDLQQKSSQTDTNYSGNVWLVPCVFIYCRFFLCQSAVRNV